MQLLVHQFWHQIPGGQKDGPRHAGPSPDINKDIAADHAIVGDAKLVLAALIDAVRTRLGDSPRGRANGIAGKIQTIKSEWLAQWAPKLNLNEAPLSPYRVIRDLMDTVDVPNAIITHDASSRAISFRPFGRRPRRSPTSAGARRPNWAMGWELAMGAKLAHPDKLCINVWGDAAIGFTGMDFETAVRERIRYVGALQQFLWPSKSRSLPVSTEIWRHQHHLRPLRRHGQSLWRLWRAHHRAGPGRPRHPPRHGEDAGRRAGAAGVHHGRRRRRGVLEIAGIEY
ncbi:MAG: thiamine pyrophosphate-dependent enzyme [Caldilineaceae bacterium]